MKAVMFSDAQNAFVLQQTEDDTPFGEVCRKVGIAVSAFYGWGKGFAGLTPSQVKWLRQLEEENGKFKRLVADISLDKAVVQDVLSNADLLDPHFWDHTLGPYIVR